jgi:two-component system chemotaxis response regulator CheB
MRVLICEDSPTYATVLSHALRADADVDVAAVCSTGEEAIALVPRLRPDVVTMDMELPGMSGLAAIEQIMTENPVPILLLSSDAPRDMEAALAAGALDAIGKGDLDLADPRSPRAVSFRERLRVLAGARVIRHPRGSLRPLARARVHSRGASVIGICASTGGPKALSCLLSRLPASFPIPVLVVQHIASGFTDGLVRWLDEAIAPAVRPVAPPTEMGPGVWIAPEGAHLVLRAHGRLAVDSQGAPGLHRPSGDVLFASLAATAGAGAVGVVLSGMGSDGADGLEGIRLAGGLTIAQDETSSVVFGMPRAAADLGAELVLSPTEIGDVLGALVPTAIGKPV